MKKTSKINAVLVELIIVILFFAIASIIVIELYATSYAKEKNSQSQTKLVNIVENQLNEYERVTPKDGKVLYYYDQDMNNVSEAEAKYIETIKVTRNNDLNVIDVDVDVLDSNHSEVLSLSTILDVKEVVYEGQ